MLQTDVTANNDRLIKSALVIALSFALSFFIQEFFTINTFFMLVAGVIAISVCFISPKIALFIIIFSTLLSPEISLGQVPFHGARTRAVVIRIEDILLIVVIFSWLAKLAISRKIHHIITTPLFKQFSVFLLITLLATMKGVFMEKISLTTSLFYFLKMTEYFFLYIMVANNLSSTKQIKIYTGAFFVAAFIVGIYCATQIGQIARLTAPFEGTAEPNTLGGYFLVILGVSIGTAFYIKSTWKKLSLIGLTVFLTILSFYTLSRATYLGAIPLFSTFFFIGRKRRIHVMILAVAVIALLALDVLVIPGAVISRVKYTFTKLDQPAESQPFGVQLDSSSMNRINKTMDVLQYFTYQPFLGYGLMGLGFIDGQYTRVLAESGLLGLIAFFWLMISLFKGVRKTTRVTSKDSFAQGLSIGFTASLAGIMAHAIATNSILIIIRIAEPLWFLAAMVIMYPNILNTELQRNNVNAVPGQVPHAPLPQVSNTETAHPPLSD